MTLVSACFTSLIEDNPSLLQTIQAAQLTLMLPLIIDPRSTLISTVHYVCFTSAPLLSACSLSPTNALYHSSSLATLVHRGDYTYRGGYHYHYQPPRIPPPVMYRPVPLSPPMTYYRPSAHVPHYHHTFKGPHMQHTYKGLAPPVSSHPRHTHKGPFHYKWKDVCLKKTVPTVATTPVALVPTLPPPPPAEPTLGPTLPPTSVVLLNTTVLPLVVTTEAPVETTAAVTLPVSTQSGLFTTVSAGRILPARFAFPTHSMMLVLFLFILFFLSGLCDWW